MKRVDANGVRLYETPGGLFPSVTTILGATKATEDKAALDAWRARMGEEEADRIRDEAAKRGSRFHAVIEGWLDTKQGLAGLKAKAPPDLYPLIVSIAPFLLAVHRPPVAVEVPVWHPLGYAGTADAVVHLDRAILPPLDGRIRDLPGKGAAPRPEQGLAGQRGRARPWLVDWKTARSHRRDEWIEDYRLQVAAYAAALPSEVEGVVIVVAVAGEPGQIAAMAGDSLVEAWRRFKLRLAFMAPIH